ncbi:MAG: ribonuclease Z [Alphaproteobacteria bacterium]|nr:ribonuclease Z [Alphaproteobacteria bacterium]
MGARELVALGTASQVPTRYRNHNGYFLRWDDQGLLFDPGEGTQRQMIYASVRTSGIHHVFITHFHGDHCLGLAGLVQRISLDGVPHPVSVSYPASGEVFFKRLRKASIFHDRSDLRPNPLPKEGGLALEEASFTVSALPLQHGVPTLGYRVEERAGRRMLPEKLAALGVRGADIGRLHREGSILHEGRELRVEEVSAPKPGQSVAVIMDTRVCENAVRLAEGVDLLVIESTYLHSEAKEARERGHLTAREAARIGQEAGARRVVLTHFSQRYGSLEPFLEEASAIHPDVVAVQDGDTVQVPPRRK